jgi:hypothetical protein
MIDNDYKHFKTAVVGAMIARAKTKMARKVAITNTSASVQIATVTENHKTVSTPKLIKQA